MAARKKATKQATPTAYVVLRLAEVREEPVDENPITEDAWLPVLVQDDGGFVPVLFHAPSKSAAIRQHTGSGESVVAGTFKAIPWSSWKGGETTRTKVTAERLPFEEGM
jgi:hypothetical protein